MDSAVGAARLVALSNLNSAVGAARLVVLSKMASHMGLVITTRPPLMARAQIPKTHLPNTSRR